MFKILKNSFGNTHIISDFVQWEQESMQEIFFFLNPRWLPNFWMIWKTRKNIFPVIFIFLVIFYKQNEIFCKNFVLLRKFKMAATKLVAHEKKREQFESRIWGNIYIKCREIWLGGFFRKREDTNGERTRRQGRKHSLPHKLRFGGYNDIGWELYFLRCS